MAGQLGKAWVHLIMMCFLFCFGYFPLSNLSSYTEALFSLFLPLSRGVLEWYFASLLKHLQLLRTAALKDKKSTLWWREARCNNCSNSEIMESVFCRYLLEDLEKKKHDFPGLCPSDPARVSAEAAKLLFGSTTLLCSLRHLWRGDLPAESWGLWDCGGSPWWPCLLTKFSEPITN